MKKLLIFLSFFSISNISIIKSAERFGIHHDLSKDGGKEMKEEKEKKESGDIKTLVDLSKYGKTFSFFNKLNLPEDIVADIFDFSCDKRYEYDQTLQTSEDISTPFLKLRNGNFVSYNREIRIWKKNSSKYDSILVGRCGYINALIEMPSGELISGDHLGNIRIWVESEPDRWKCIQTLHDHNETIITILALENNQFISSGHDGTLRIWKKNETGLYNSIKVLIGHGLVQSIFKIQDDLILFSHNPRDSIRILSKKHGEWELAQTHEFEKSYPVCFTQLKDNSFVYFENLDTVAKIFRKIGDKWQNIQNISFERYIGKVNYPFFKIVELQNSNLAFFDSQGNFDDVIIFKKNKTGGYEYFQTLKGTADSTLSLIELSNGNLASLARDGKITIWQYSKIKVKYECIQSFDVKCEPDIFEHSFFINELQNGSLAIVKVGGKSIKIWSHNNFVDIKSKQKNLLIRLYKYLKNNHNARRLILSAGFSGLLLKKPEARKKVIIFMWTILFIMEKNPKKFIYYGKEFLSLVINVIGISFTISYAEVRRMLTLT